MHRQKASAFDGDDSFEANSIEGIYVVTVLEKEVSVAFDIRDLKPLLSKPSQTFGDGHDVRRVVAGVTNPEVKEVSQEQKMRTAFPWQRLELADQWYRRTARAAKMGVRHHRDRHQRIAYI